MTSIPSKGNSYPGSSFNHSSSSGSSFKTGLDLRRKEEENEELQNLLSLLDMTSDAMIVSPLVKFADSYFNFVAQFKQTFSSSEQYSISQGNIYFYVYDHLEVSSSWSS